MEGHNHLQTTCDADICARRFLASDALRVVFDFADAQLENAASSYSLASNFPRRVFTAQVSGKAFTSLCPGLQPQ